MMVIYGMMYFVISVKQTSITWPHFFSYSYYLVLYSFVLCSLMPQSTEMKMSWYSKEVIGFGNSEITVLINHRNAELHQ